MLSFIGFIGFSIAWVIGGLILGMLINVVRVNQGNTKINDGMTAFIQGFTFGPVGIMAAFHAQQASQGKTFPMALGGIVGTISFFYCYGMT